jgi:hypothetical protein
VALVAKGRRGRSIFQCRLAEHLLPTPRFAQSADVLLQQSQVFDLFDPQGRSLVRGTEGSVAQKAQPLPRRLNGSSDEAFGVCQGVKHPSDRRCF